MTTLFKRAGIKGSSHSGRRGFAGKVPALSGDMDTAAILLGHSSIDCSQRYVDMDPATLKVCLQMSCSKTHLGKVSIDNYAALLYSKEEDLKACLLPLSHPRAR